MIKFARARPVLFLFVVAVLVRFTGNLIFDLATPGLERNFDAASSGEISDMARGLLRTGTFSYYYAPDAQGELQITPSAYQPPLYPSFLAGIFWLLDDSHQKAFITVQIIQSLLGGLIAVMVFWLATRFLERDWALLAGVLACFWPAYAYMPNEAHPISALVADILWMTILSVDIVRHGATVKRCAWLGLAFAICVVTRSEVIPGIVVASLILFKQTRAPAVLLALAIGMSMEGIWIYRNYLTLGKPLLTTTLGLNLFRGNGPTATGGSYEANGQIVWETPATIAGVEALPWSKDYEIKRDNVYMEEFKKSLKGDELRPLRLLPIKFFYFWTADFTHPKGKSPLVWVPWLCLFPFTVWGMIALWRKPAAWALYFWCGYYLLIELCLFALPRYRMGVESMFLIFAAAGMYQLWARRRPSAAIQS